MGEVAFRFLQGSLETSKGSNNAATRKLLARVTSLNIVQPKEYVEEDRGTLVAANRYVAGVDDVTLTVEAQATFEQLPWFLQTAVRGSVSPTTVGSTGKRAVFVPNTTTSGDLLQAASLEFGDDTQGYLARYCEADKWTLGFDALQVGQAAPLMMTIDYIAKSVTSNSRTTGLQDPTVESILATGARFMLGDTSTGYGSLSELPASLRSLKITGENKLGRKVFVGDGRQFSAVGPGRRMVTGEMTLEGDANGVTRFTEWKTETQKRMRLIFAGSTISGSSPATARQLWIDARFDITEFDVIGEIDTNTVYLLKFRCVEDALHATPYSDIAITVTNDQSSYT